MIISLGLIPFSLYWLLIYLYWIAFWIIVEHYTKYTESGVWFTQRRQSRQTFIGPYLCKLGRCSSFISLSNLCYSVVSCPIVNMISLTLLAGSLTFSILCKERCKIEKISSASFFLKHTFLSVRPQLYRFVGDGSITRTYFNSYQIGCEFQFPFHFQYKLSFCRSC